MGQPIRQDIRREQFDAVLLDLDGVITDTASVHARCWKQMFDEFLRKRAEERGEAFRPFDLTTDYRLYVDGKPRFDGVRDFLKSRGIQLPEGSLDDPPDAETVAGLGNRKNILFDKIIQEGGVHPYPGSVKLIEELRERRFEIAVVSSSHNCTAVLKAARLDACFDAQVDGNTIDGEHLAGETGSRHLSDGGEAAWRQAVTGNRHRGCYRRSRGRLQWALRTCHRCRPARGWQGTPQ